MRAAKALRLTAIGIALATTAALAQGPGYGYGPGPGYGRGMTGGGYGPGMMGGGYGPGMMAGGGMMGGYGYGPGGGLAALNLTDEQREKILAIQEENRRRNWDAMGKMRAEMFRLRSLYFADKVDPNAYAEQQKKVDDLRRQMTASRIEARNQMEQVLNPEQRKQFRSFGPWWLQDEAE